MAMTPAERAKAYRNRKKEAGTPAKGGGNGKRLPAAWPGPCVYLDGEAYEGEGYTLLQTLDPRDGAVYTTESESGRLSTDLILEHLFLPPKAIHFGYGLGYDVSNWLRDIPRDTLTDLLARGFVRWGRWKLDWLPGKMLKVCDRSRPPGDRQRVVYDLCPFYQRPFITALEEASLEVPEVIRIGKRLRGRFTRETRDFVSEYNIAELHAMHALHTSLCQTLEAGDCKIRHWFGPGSCARLTAKQHGVTIADDEQQAFLKSRRRSGDLWIGDAPSERHANPHACVVDAFFGGRFELSRQGPVDACWEYDLSSAYPWALASGMPCFACGGRWEGGEITPGMLPTYLNRWTVLEVSWQAKPLTTPTNTPTWGPFPMRLTRNLAWTREGRGWYHKCEVDAAVTHLSHLYDIRVHAFWSWHPTCQHDPWSWVGDAAAERVALKHTDPSRAQCLKLSLNSLYGITADKAGVDRGRVPRYHNPYWAGLITARTRARMLEAAGVGGDDIIYLATDGVHSSRPLDLPTGDGLGDWEVPKRAGMPAVFLGPGTYLYDDGKRGKSRGVNLGKFTDQIRTWERLYRMTAPRGQINLLERHFVPVREALSRSRMQPPERFEDIVNTWATRPRELSYNLAPRREPAGVGRWVAPSLSNWLAFGQAFLVPTDQQMIDAETWASDQPEWGRHKLDAV